MCSNFGLDAKQEPFLHTTPPVRKILRKHAWASNPTHSKNIIYLKNRTSNRTHYTFPSTRIMHLHTLSAPLVTFRLTWVHPTQQGAIAIHGHQPGVVPTGTDGAGAFRCGAPEWVGGWHHLSFKRLGAFSGDDVDISSSAPLDPAEFTPNPLHRGLACDHQMKAPREHPRTAVELGGAIRPHPVPTTSAATGGKWFSPQASRSPRESGPRSWPRLKRPGFRGRRREETL